ncbi:MAG: hypothetical protein R6V03_03435 [Kiritimatiellia bacterium]
MTTSEEQTTRSSFGCFRNGGKEFVVTETDTPRPLMNYAWNSRFISALSQHAGGNGAYKERAIQYIDSRGRCLLVRDGHRCFYVRDESNGEFWSPGRYPAGAPLDEFACVHGFGYSTLRSVRKGIETRLRWFVPENEPCEIWTVTLANTRNETASLKWFTFADLLLAGYPAYCDYYSSLSGEHDEASGITVCLNTNPDRTHEWFGAFAASDIRPAGFDTSRKSFLGIEGCPNRPEAVVKGACGGSLAANEKLAAATEHAFTLEPGSEATFNIIIGACMDTTSAGDIAERVLEPGAPDREFDSLLERKRAMVERLSVRTPVPKVNYLVNGWLKQQVRIYADVGSDNGRGFRDAMQLIWATASFDLDYTKKMLVECLGHQYSDGHTLRGWLPVDDHHYSDGPVWIAPVVETCILESGDPSVLDVEVPFFDGGTATVWEHALRGLRHSSEDLGPHGLVRCRFGDWNDSLTGVDLEGKGESVWTSMGIVYGLKTAARLAKRLNRGSGLEEELARRADSLTRSILEQGWDGKWFLRAINDLGEPVGSESNEEGKIWLLPQVWAVLAGIVEGRRAGELLEQVDSHLDTPYGFKTLHPAYTSFRKHVGRLTQIAPGMWENGAPYCHANGFKILADCAAGRGRAAYETYMKVMPDSETNPSTRSGCEPYVFTNQYIGPDNRRSGQTQFAWMTGTAGWFLRAVTEGMLGVRPDYDGLRVDPCLHPAWQECGMTRDFRGARYHVKILNPRGLEKGTVNLEVDGQSISGNLAPVFRDAAEHHITAELKPCG